MSTTVFVFWLLFITSYIKHCIFETTYKKERHRPLCIKLLVFKQLIRKRHRPLLSLSDPPSPSFHFGSPAANPSFPLSLLFSIAPACQSTLSPPNRALRFVPSFLAPLSAFSPLHPLTGVAYASTPLGLSAVSCQSSFRTNTMQSYNKM